MIFCYLKESLDKSLNDPQVEQEILDSIESIFFSDETFDASEYKLKVILLTNIIKLR